jgi:hypothetical protein
VGAGRRHCDEQQEGTGERAEAARVHRETRPLWASEVNPSRRIIRPLPRAPLRPAAPSCSMPERVSGSFSVIQDVCRQRTRDT